MLLVYHNTIPTTSKTMTTITQICVFFWTGGLFSGVEGECLDGVCAEPLASLAYFTKEGVIDEGKIPFPFLCFLFFVLFHPLLSFPPTRGLFVLILAVVMNAYYNVLGVTVTKLVLVALIWLF